MTNQELYNLIKEMKAEMKTDREADLLARQDMTKEFYLFKGKAFGFMVVLSGAFAFVSDYLFKTK